MLDALERDLAGPVVFPLSDGAEVDGTHCWETSAVQEIGFDPTRPLDQSRSHSESASVQDQVASDDTESLVDLEVEFCRSARGPYRTAMRWRWRRRTRAMINDESGSGRRW